MSAMSDMLGDILKKALPAEVMAMLTPENVQEIGNKANAFITEMRGSMKSIEDNQTLILKKLERMEVNGGSDNSIGAGKPSGSADSGRASDG